MTAPCQMDSMAKKAYYYVKRHVAESSATRQKVTGSQKRSTDVTAAELNDISGMMNIEFAKMSNNWSHFG